MTTVEIAWILAALAPIGLCFYLFLVIRALYLEMVKRRLAPELFPRREKPEKPVTRTEKARAAIAAKGGAHE